MKRLAGVVLVLFSIIAASTVTSCESNPSATSVDSNGDFMRRKKRRYFNVHYVADMAFMQDIHVTDAVEQERSWLTM